MFPKSKGRLPLVPLMIGLAFLSGCETVLSDPETVRPVIANYSPEFLTQAVDAMDALPDGSPLIVMIIDYQRERDRLRECR